EEGGTVEQHAAFGRWLLESPRHVEEALALRALHRATDRFDPERELALEPDGQRDVISFSGRAETTHSRSRYSRRAAVAASILIGTALLGWGVWSGALGGARQYSTAVGEQRAFDLPDGSIVHLNTQSRLRVHFSAGGRDIRLLSGEALFRVAPDASRP